MASHITLPGRHRRPKERTTRERTARGVSRPTAGALAVCAVLYGLWAEVVVRHGDGAFTGGQVVLAVVSAVVFFALWYGLVRFRYALPREARAAAFGLLFGVTVGFLYSLSGNSVLTVAVASLFCALGAGLGAFYLFYTHE
ncbi:hypothetical protein [Streptomyces sp. NPDC015131]|uniref:hypothetical protein n=1 Tax=Streptomyces sp. NPDC015131 TaxID=3364941 RepID=UPI00370001AF